jgi:glycine/D-amino acid oxidase-like deaminating enzyme
MNADVAVVGGGIVGSSVAYHLARRSDRDVAVFERAEQLAGETTAKSNAMFRMTGSAAERRMKRYGLSVYTAVLGEPAVDHDVDPLYERVDRLEVATSESSATALRDRAGSGVGELLDPGAIPEHVLFPELRRDDIEAALSFPGAIRLEPRVLAREFAARARAAGARFETDTAVRDVHVEDGAVTGLATDAGRVEAPVVLCAAGPNNPDVAAMAGYDLPVRHTLGPILDVRPRALGHTVPNLKHDDSGVYYTGRGDGTVMIGRAGGGYDRATRRDLADLDESHVPVDLRETMDDAAAALFPPLRLDAVDIRDEWVGLVSKTPDGEPIVGLTDVEGFGVAAFNSEGIQLAPAAGQILAEQVLEGRPPSDYPHVAPGRFGD